MDIYRQTVGEFCTGQGTTSTVSAPIVASDSSRFALKGVRVHAGANNAGPIYVGPSGVSIATGYPLNAGESVLIQVDNPSKVSVVAAGAYGYSWISE
jgi:hypothetical protein